MKSTKRHFRLEEGEYLMTADHPDVMKEGGNIRIILNGKNITESVIALIRYHKEKE